MEFQRTAIPSLVRLDEIVKVEAKVEVHYYLPDRPNFIGPPLMWETSDEYPYFPRIHRFLNYWKAEVQARVEKITIMSNKGIFNPRMAHRTTLFEGTLH